ncbi:MAG: cytochrome c biogenesis protein CcdA, partial [Candidatus Bathyarchaeia archaeon]
MFRLQNPKYIIFGGVGERIGFVMLCVAMTLLYITSVCYSLEPVRIEFLYYDRFCQGCLETMRDHQAYLHNREVLMSIQRDYGERVIVKEIFFFSEEGLEKMKQYNLGLGDWNSIIVNGELVLRGGKRFINETLLREIIDLYLTNSSINPQIINSDQKEPTIYMPMGIMATAFILGFFESFSPCVLIMLSFVVGYTLSDRNQFRAREGFFKVLIFGISFTLASAIFGLICGSLFSLTSTPRLYLTLIVCFLAIIFGFNLLGIIKFPIQSKPLIKKLLKRYALGYIKIFLLGLIFYFLDPCIAPIFASITAILFSGELAFALFLFCIGEMIPFVGAGLLAGSISKISREAYKHRVILRGISGAILIGYAIYILLHSIIV